MTSNAVLNYMLTHAAEGPITWERYLEFAYLGDPPQGEFLVEDFAEFRRAMRELSGEDQDAEEG